LSSATFDPAQSLLASVLTAVEPLARSARNSDDNAPVFAAVTRQGTMLVCQAPASAAPAFYRLSIEQEKLAVSLVTPDRYLSQSIEQDLVHTGDKMGDLLRDELIDLNCWPVPGISADAIPTVEHFRSPPPDKLYTFRVLIRGIPSDLSGATQLALNYLLAFEQTFRRLGDMAAGGEE
jgi:hypothetical protein